jgi:uncharacterized membrane protein YqjE
MDAAPEPASGGLKAALARLAESALGAFRTRAELATVELVEERERLVLRLSLLAGGLLLIAFAALFAGAFVIVLFWNTHRLRAIALVAVAYLAIGALLVAKAKSIGRAAPTPFAATLAELEKDRLRLARAVRDPAEKG